GTAGRSIGKHSVGLPDIRFWFLIPTGWGCLVPKAGHCFHLPGISELRLDKRLKTIFNDQPVWMIRGIYKDQVEMSITIGDYQSP
ncbi:MAG: hypothetical protein PVH87_12170, partial [Desulfobacteraceae bacterium]